jgi:hypothetical protein
MGVEYRQCHRRHELFGKQTDSMKFMDDLKYGNSGSRELDRLDHCAIARPYYCILHHLCIIMM